VIRTYITTRAVDVQIHGLGAIHTVQVEHGSYYLVTELLINILPKEYDPLTILQHIHPNISINRKLLIVTLS
jgi:hypothetical protein